MAHVKEGPPTKVDVLRGQGRSHEVGTRPQVPRPMEANPLAFMRRFAADMDRFYEDFGLRLPGLFGRGRELFRREVGLIPAEWSPRIDVRMHEGQFLVQADLPGLTKDDIKIELTSEMLTIQGERKQEKQEKREGCLYSECSYGSFYRSVPIPEGVDTTKAKAEFQNGVLEITMPAPTQPVTQPRLLEIHESK